MTGAAGGAGQQVPGESGVAPASVVDGWSACGASVLGASHARRNAGNEDAFRCLERSHAPVAAVADGHGATVHVRSAAGARIAVDLLATELAANDRGDDLQTIKHELHAGAGRFIQQWRSAVLAAVAADPFSPAEQEALASDPGAAAPTAEQLAFRAYGTTVLGIHVGAGWVRAVAIGDGDLGCVDLAGNHHTLCPLPDAIGVQTDSLASSNPVAAVRTDARPAADIVAAWACTDGFSTAQADPTWRDLVARQLREMLLTRTPAEIGADLDGWLQPAAEVGDDTTMVLLLRNPGSTDRPPVDSGGSPYDLLGTTLPPREQRRRRGLWRRL
jgi:Protein phosphatase 2C